MSLLPYGLSLNPHRRPESRKARHGPPIGHGFQHIMQQATCQSIDLFDFALASILHSEMGKGGYE
jgi:hypothetical protein